MLLLRFGSRDDISGEVGGGRNLIVAAGGPPQKDIFEREKSQEYDRQPETGIKMPQDKKKTQTESEKEETCNIPYYYLRMMHF